MMNGAIRVNGRAPQIGRHDVVSAPGVGVTCSLSVRGVSFFAANNDVRKRVGLTNIQGGAQQHLRLPKLVEVALGRQDETQPLVRACGRASHGRKHPLRAGVGVDRCLRGELAVCGGGLRVRKRRRAGAGGACSEADDTRYRGTPKMAAF